MGKDKVFSADFLSIDFLCRFDSLPARFRLLCIIGNKIAAQQICQRRRRLLQYFCTSHKLTGGIVISTSSFFTGPGNG
jgi:hypothetical protein